MAISGLAERSGPPTAPAELAQVFQEHQSRVFRAAFRITGNASDAEDVLQSVFLRLLRREHEFEAVENLESYLYRAAINASLDVLRTRRQRLSVALEEVPRSQEAGLGTADAGSAFELSEWLRGALARLSPRWAEMFILRYIDGYDNREIAEMLDTSQAVVAVTLHRVRGQLKKDFYAYQRGNHVQ